MGRRATTCGPLVNGGADRRREAALAGHSGDVATARGLLHDPVAGVRATALAALARLGAVTKAEVRAALADDDPAVRQRACEVSTSVEGVETVALLGDDDPRVAEVAAWALGEQESDAAGVVEALTAMAGNHSDALCREAAVAALGAIGDERGLPAILAATTDKATVRRRAVISLAPFAGPAVDAALEAAMSDRDWQVRQAAEDLRGTR
ncbi:MAG: HEAT repeat domain-containing protein [Actinomycetota bacterium]|nr:HEAT repeat domain-containing protein [Actinomycetota bacterium]